MKLTSKIHEYKNAKPRLDQDTKTTTEEDRGREGRGRRARGVGVLEWLNEEIGNNQL